MKRSTTSTWMRNRLKSKRVLASPGDIVKLVSTFNARDLTSGVDIFKVTASTPTHLQLPWCSNNESHCRNLSFSLVLKSLDRTTEDGNTTFTVVTVVYKCLYIGDLDETYSR
ncbi:hypothetical protein AVEN_156802-1 [Araneus ventricosus]|uniref:Uncharacterized protein n=1 Tax=Araneus ventricosus TaxID=182803 RepID=A0A4Y2ISY1_ARAVE|nr:hypothetical protein AVEN_156802-1 [Araneus ventricosus]